MAIASETSFEIQGIDRASPWLRPLPLLLTFLLIQTVAWTVIPPLVFTAHNSNTMELALWARDWYVVNYKHPALPSWLLSVAYFLFGTRLWVPYFVAELCISAAMLAVFGLGHAILGARRALFAVLLLTTVHAFTLEAIHYNHNTVQLAFWAAFCLGLWRASRDSRLRWWLFTSVVAALGIYAKFSVLMVIAFGSVWILADPVTRARLRSRAPYLALGLFVVLLLPLALALMQQRFGAVRWIAAESSKRGLSTTHILMHMGAVVARMLLALAAGMLIALLIRKRRPDRQAPDAMPSDDRRGMAFLALMGAGPLLLTIALAVFRRLRPEWLDPMYSLLGLLLVAAVALLTPRLRRWTEAGLPHMVIALAGTLWVLAGQIDQGRTDFATATDADRLEYPAAEMSQRFDRLWAERVGTPLTIVGGDNWTAGVVGLLSAARPSLFSYLDPAHAPAMTPERVGRAGMLVLWSPASTWMPQADLLARYPHGRETFIWSSAPTAHPIEIDYAIVAPGAYVPASAPN